MDREAWQFIVYGVAIEWDMTEYKHTHTHTHTHIIIINKKKTNNPVEREFNKHLTRAYPKWPKKRKEKVYNPSSNQENTK